MKIRLGVGSKYSWQHLHTGCFRIGRCCNWI